MVRSIAAIVAVALSQVVTTRVPRIDTKGPEPVLVLPDAMAQALKTFDPDFKPRRFADYPSWIRQDKAKLSAVQAPFAVVGDFNGDKVLDVVIDGDDRVSGRRLVILSSGAAFQVTEVDKERRTPGEVRVGLTLVRPGVVRSPHESKPLRLQTDAFEVDYYETSAKVVYLTGGTWHEYWTSD
jgi:hypothetical protein